MKDLYKRLNLDPAATPQDIRAALGSAADEPTRAAAQFILLSPRRRAVYDRNHRVLSTIGQLRGRLALGLRPFWSHGHHHDFTVPFSPTAPSSADPFSVINAAGQATRQRRRWPTARSAWIILAIAMLIIVLASAWKLWR
jgi:hypothetical protein